jgi:hypothetical protein
MQDEEFACKFCLLKFAALAGELWTTKICVVLKKTLQNMKFRHTTFTNSVASLLSHVSRFLGYHRERNVAIQNSDISVG